MKKAFIYALFSLSIFAVAFSTAHAGSEHNMIGWAWSSNIGWISFNSTNDHNGTTPGVQPSAVNYGVNKAANGTLTGYAWSPNIGWIQFGGLSSGFPVGAGTVSSDAVISGSNLQGWARALSNGGAWDGWIALSGTGYGVTQSGNNFAGYAWGDDVVGWIRFDVQNIAGICTDCGVAIGGTSTLLSSATGNVPYGTIATLTYTVSDLPPGGSCTLSKTSAGGTSFTAVTNITANGNTNTPGLSDASYTFELACTSMTTKSASFTVDAQPAGFTLGEDETMPIQFISAGTSTSQTMNILINEVGGFTGTVTVSIGGISPALPPGTTIEYSLGGAAYTQSPTPVVVSYDSFTTLKVRVSKKLTSVYEITVNGACASGCGGGIGPDAKIFNLDPNALEPTFEEF